MYSCVRVITPSGGTVPFTETYNGITDARTGIPFRVRTMFLVGGNTAGINLLTYWGMASSNSAGDSGFHWDWGFMHDTGGGSGGSGVCYDFSGKIASGAGGYGYPFMDTWPDIFFGGYIAGYGYVNNVQLGSFDITWIRRDRSGDSKIMLCVGDTDYGVYTLAGAANGVVGPPLNPLPSKPQGVMQFPASVAALGAGPAVTGAGGSSVNLGWDARDSNKGATLIESISQGGNDREYWLDRMSYPGAYISAWADDNYTIAGANGGGGLQVVWCGTNVVCKAGYFPTPTTDADYSFNMGLDAKLVFFQTIGLSTPAIQDTNLCSVSYGFCDPALSQCSYWTGDTTVGNGVPLKGTRYLSNSQVTRVGLANAVSTTFANIGAVESLRPNGDIRLGFTATDGTAPIVLWFAVGLEAVPDEAGRGKGIYKLVPDKLQDTIWYDATTESKYLAEKPAPSAHTFLAGDE